MIKMEEEAGNYKEYKNNFCLSETHLRKIYSVMEEYAAKIEDETNISIYITRENDSFYKTQDIEKILIDENISGKSIESLKIEITVVNEDSQSENEQKKAVIIFSKKKDMDIGIRIQTSYKERDWCFLLVDELDTQVQRLINKESTSLMKARLFDLVLAIITFTVLVSGSLWYINSSKIEIPNVLTKSLEEKVNFLVQQEVAQNSDVYIVMPMFLLSLIIFLFLIEFKIITKLIMASNISVFYWGDFIQIHDDFTQKILRIKWGIGIGFIVSLAASILVNIY